MIVLSELYLFQSFMEDQSKVTKQREFEEEHSIELLISVLSPRSHHTKRQFFGKQEGSFVCLNSNIAAVQLDQEGSNNKF